MKFNNFSDIEKHLQGQLNAVLQDEVSEVIKDEMKTQIYEEVYSVYNPKMYHRRYGNGGLGDEQNIQATLVNDGVLAVENIAPFNGSNSSGKSLAGVIVSGSGYNFGSKSGNLGYEQPRDFVSATRNSLLDKGAHIRALKAGLKKRGIDIK
jgi:hypothetical protein